MIELLDNLLTKGFVFVPSTHPKYKEILCIIQNISDIKKSYWAISAFNSKVGTLIRRKISGEGRQYAARWLHTDEAIDSKWIVLSDNCMPHVVPHVNNGFYILNRKVK